MDAPCRSQKREAPPFGMYAREPAIKDWQFPNCHPKPTRAGGAPIYGRLVPVPRVCALEAPSLNTYSPNWPPLSNYLAKIPPCATLILDEQRVAPWRIKQRNWPFFAPKPHLSYSGKQT